MAIWRFEKQRTVHMGTLVVALVAVACSPNEAGDPGSADAGASIDGRAGGADANAPGPDAMTAGTCSVGADGLGCLLDLYDDVVATCDTDKIDAMRDNLDARAGTLPIWHDGRALFVTMGADASVAGAFNAWVAGDIVTQRVCTSTMYIADAQIPSGHYQYKMTRADEWWLDPLNWAFAYDDFGGNPDGRNSVLNTYDSGVGHLVMPTDEVCSTELGNCRALQTYLPPGYGAPANASRRYPTVFMHDGQNIFDDKDCCFGHTGWEVNVTADSDIAAGIIEPMVIVGASHSTSRNDEYGWSTAAGGLQEPFMQFQINTVQPTAAAYWRVDPARVYTAGSSLGGLIAFRLAFEYPDVYAGAASISGAFWPGQDTDTAMRDIVVATGKVPAALYMDHGGSAQSGSDGYFDNLEVRDLLEQAGWQRADSPGCTAGENGLCYHHEPGALHDELAWRDRAYRWLRYLFPVNL